MFKRFNDRFGLAYSFCGQSNALRMQKKIAEALPLMKRAERLYRSLQLKGPLAFVLWSQSQAYCALKRWPIAAKLLKEADDLFHSAHDQRGILYANLGRAEILLRKNNLIYQSVFRKALKTAARLHLPFERAHAIRTSNPQLAARWYRRCGVAPNFFRYNALP
jgi:hypothetical protein